MAADKLWEGLAQPSLLLTMVGSVWGAIAFLSLLGLFSPHTFR